MYNILRERKSLSEYPISWQPPVVPNEKSEDPSSSVKMTRLPSIGQMLAGIPGLSTPLNPYQALHQDEYSKTHTHTSRPLSSERIAVHQNILPPLTGIGSLQQHIHSRAQITSPEAAVFDYRYPKAQVASPPCTPPSKVLKKRGRKKKANATCKQCLLTQTPEWRCGPAGSRTLCNACGLYFLKLKKRFGFQEASQIFRYKKQHNQVHVRVVPSSQEKQFFCIS